MSREEVLIRVTGALVFGYVVCLLFVLAVMGWSAVRAEGRVGATLVWVAIMIAVWAASRLTPRPRLVVRGIDLLSPELSGERFVGLFVVFALLGTVNSAWG